MRTIQGNNMFSTYNCQAKNEAADDLIKLLDDKIKVENFPKEHYLTLGDSLLGVIITKFQSVLPPAFKKEQKAEQDKKDLLQLALISMPY